MKGVFPIAGKMPAPSGLDTSTVVLVPYGGEPVDRLVAPAARVEMAAQVCSGADSNSPLYNPQESKCYKGKNFSKRRLA